MTVGAPIVTMDFRDAHGVCLTRRLARQDAESGQGDADPSKPTGNGFYGPWCARNPGCTEGTQGDPIPKTRRPESGIRRLHIERLAGCS